MKPSEIFFSIVRIPVDFGMAILAFVLAYYLRLKTDSLTFAPEIDYSVFLNFEEYMADAILGTALLLIIFALLGGYAMRTTTSLGYEMRNVLVGALIWTMAIISYFFVIREFPFSRLVLGFTAVFIILLVWFGRILVKLIQRALLVFGIGKRRILFIGTNDVAFDLAQAFSRAGNYEVVGALGSPWSAKNADNAELVPVLGTVDKIVKVAHKLHIDQVIQTREDLGKMSAENLIELCREHHFEYQYVPDLLDVYRSNVVVHTVRGIPVISLKSTRLDGWGRVYKRGFDFVVALLSLTLLLPVFLLIALAIRLDSRGTVFFRYLDDGRKAKRVGQRGSKFHCLKFRTMKMNTHSLRYTESLQKKNKRKGPLTKIENDPRVTRVGFFLRKYSLDELPQLWNVLIGEMSLVGPRPHLPEEVERYKQHHKFVLTIKPGITGLAQIGGRSDLDFEEEVRLDTYYIENWSPWLDIKILLRTPLVVLRGYRE